MRDYDFTHFIGKKVRITFHSGAENCLAGFTVLSVYSQGITISNGKDSDVACFVPMTAISRLDLAS